MATTIRIGKPKTLRVGGRAVTPRPAQPLTAEPPATTKHKGVAKSRCPTCVRVVVR